MTETATTYPTPKNCMTNEKLPCGKDMSGFKLRMDTRLEAVRRLKAGNDETSPLLPAKENARV